MSSLRSLSASGELSSLKPLSIYHSNNRHRLRRASLGSAFSYSARSFLVSVLQLRSGFWLLKAVLAVHVGTLVHVGLGYVYAAAAGNALLYALADKAAHEEGAALYTPVGLGVP